MAILYGLLVGLALGLTGGGGSIFAVPLLIYGLGVNASDATVISLATVALMSAVGAGGALRARLVEFQVAMFFVAGGILAAPAGIKLNQQVDSETVITAFAGLMLIVAVFMWLKASRHPENSRVVRADFIPAILTRNHPICQFSEDGTLSLGAPCTVVLALSGAMTGLLSGFFGVGGGFIIVPTLMFVTRMGIHQAVATSLLVIAMIGLAGSSAALVSGRELPWLLCGLFLAGGIIGMISGRLLARKLAGPLLQKAFAGVMVFVALLILYFR